MKPSPHSLQCKLQFRSFLADNINPSEKGLPDYRRENIDFLTPVSKPDLLFDPLPDPGHLAPDEDCLVVFFWTGSQSCGESTPRSQNENDGCWRLRGFFLSGLPNLAIQSLMVFLSCCIGARLLTQPV